MTEYEAFVQKWKRSDCHRCGLYTKRKNIVVDRGTPGTGLMFIGEAPGPDEDESGTCFVGRAGKLLAEVISGFGLNLDTHVLCTNVVMCFPGKSGSKFNDPSPASIDACKDRLREQVELANPSIICLAGKVAVDGVLGVKNKKKRPITDVAGHPVVSRHWPGRVFLPMFHPSHVSRNAAEVAREYARQIKVLCKLIELVRCGTVTYAGLTELGKKAGCRGDDYA